MEMRSKIRDLGRGNAEAGTTEEHAASGSTKTHWHFDEINASQQPYGQGRLVLVAKKASSASAL